MLSPVHVNRVEITALIEPGGDMHGDCKWERLISPFPLNSLSPFHSSSFSSVMVLLITIYVCLCTCMHVCMYNSDWPHIHREAEDELGFLMHWLVLG